MANVADIAVLIAAGVVVLSVWLDRPRESRHARVERRLDNLSEEQRKMTINAVWLSRRLSVLEQLAVDDGRLEDPAREHLQSAQQGFPGLTAEQLSRVRWPAPDRQF